MKIKIAYLLNNKKLNYVLCICSAFFLVGCASVTGTRNQPVTVTTTFEGIPIAGAHCTLQNDKGLWVLTTPGSVVIQKSYSDLSLSCRKDPTHVGSSTFKSASEAAIWGNIIAGGLIGYAIDSSSGAGFSYPPNMNVQLVRQHTH